MLRRKHHRTQLNKRLQAELDRKVAELQEQTDKVRQLESSKARAEAVAARRDKSLQELMEKNRQVFSWRGGGGGGGV